MSIIYDALKKVEKNTESGPQNKAAENVNHSRKPNPMLIYILVVLIGLFIGNMIFKKMTQQKSVPIVPATPPVLISVNSLPPQPEETKPILPSEPEEKRQPSLTLNGVFFEQDKGYALINNRILSIGDDIQGATVKEISLDKTILEFDGKEITLTKSSK